MYICVLPVLHIRFAHPPHRTNRHTHTLPSMYIPSTQGKYIYIHDICWCVCSTQRMVYLYTCVSYVEGWYMYVCVLPVLHIRCAHPPHRTNTHTHYPPWYIPSTQGKSIYIHDKCWCVCPRRWCFLCGEVVYVRMCSTIVLRKNDLCSCKMAARKSAKTAGEDSGGESGAYIVSIDKKTTAYNLGACEITFFANACFNCPQQHVSVLHCNTELQWCFMNISDIQDIHASMKPI